MSYMTNSRKSNSRREPGCPHPDWQENYNMAYEWTSSVVFHPQVEIKYHSNNHEGEAVVTHLTVKFPAGKDIHGNRRFNTAILDMHVDNEDFEKKLFGWKKSAQKRKMAKSKREHFEEKQPDIWDRFTPRHA